MIMTDDNVNDNDDNYNDIDIKNYNSKTIFEMPCIVTDTKAFDNTPRLTTTMHIKYKIQYFDALTHSDTANFQLFVAFPAHYSTQMLHELTPRTSNASVCLCFYTVLKFCSHPNLLFPC